MAGRSAGRLRRARLANAGAIDGAANADAGIAASDSGSGVGGAENVTVNPDAAFGDASGNAAAEPAAASKRRGGWPAGKPRGSASAKETRPQLAVGGFRKGLDTSFNILARWTGIPDLALTPDESQLLAESVAEVNRYYKMPMMKPEHIALCALAGAVASVGQTKVRAVAKHKLKQAAAKPAAAKPAEKPASAPNDLVATATNQTVNGWMPDFNSNARMN